MTPDRHTRNKEVVGRLRAALYDLDPNALRGRLRALFAPDAAIHLSHPFEDLDGPDGLHDRAYAPLIEALPDLERRDDIVIAGPGASGDWFGCAGHYLGVFERPLLDIPPTLHLAAMRYCEFFRLEGERIVEMQALWDLPQLMLQADAWPLAPSLGVELMVPGPATHDGLVPGPRDEARSQTSLALVRSMLEGLGRFADGGAEAMELERSWHPKMNWYGPAGIGSMRRISGFRHWHQIPFLRAMPDRTANLDGDSALFGDGDYVGFTAWPGMEVTVSGDGWLGIAPSGQRLTMRSLDFWRCEGDQIRENWVLVDLLHVYHQLGVDVFERMRERTAARQPRPLGL